MSDFTGQAVYILGAGFSAQFGLPVVSNFLEKSKDMYFVNQKGFEDFEKVFQAINRLSVTKNYLQTDLSNIEEILSILEMEHFLNPGHRDILSRDEFADYIKQVIDHYTPANPGLSPITNVSNWYNWIVDGQKLRNSYLSALTCFVGTASNLQITENDNSQLECSIMVGNAPSFTILSLNYDRLIEIGADIIDQTTSNNKSFSGPSVHKLHGSVDSYIIPPTWAKGDSKVAQVWTEAYDALSKANHIIFLGYSLPEGDSYFRYFLKSALHRVEHLKSIDVICLDDTGDVKKRYEQLISFGNFRFASAYTSQYLDVLRMNIHSRNTPIEFDRDFMRKHDGFMTQHSRI